jgi:hypothetical protein
LFEVQLVCCQTRLLGQFPAGRHWQIFLRVIQEAAGKRQHAAVWLDAALDKQHLEVGITHREDNEIHSEKHGGRYPMTVGHGLTVALLSL